MFRAFLLFLSLLASAPADTFVDPIAEGADPWVVKDGDRYLWCNSDGNRGISLWVSDRLSSLGNKHMIWKAPEKGPFAKQVWAPELHRLDGRWYVYFAASDGENANHLAYVLGSRSEDPLGPYTLHGPFATGEGPDGKSPNGWAIDMTVLELGGKRYAVWSGWDAPGSDRQYLYIAPMKSPIELAGPRVRLAANDTHLWERTEETEQSRGLAEGPQVLQHGGRTFVTYSTAASWLPTYKLGMLELTGGDPLDPAAWTKFPQPVFQSTDATFGVGHSCFVKSPDDTEWWHVYHAKRDRKAGWQRAIFIQPFTFTADGVPAFGRPVAPGTLLSRPSGEKAFAPKLSLTVDFTQGRQQGFSYYGHLQFMKFDKNGLNLGAVPEESVNGYRSGEKLVLEGGDFGDFTATTRMSILEGDRDAGLLFRVTLASVGYDAQRGYFAGLNAGDQTVILGKTDGGTWSEIAHKRVPFDPKKEQELGVVVHGTSITVTLAGKPVLSAEDESYARGSVGLRVVDTHASFKDLEVKEH